ncbi:arginine--tRNA ligase [Bdellovibrionota bacterium FG-1]
MERFAKLAAQALNQVLENPIGPADLEMPPDPKLGDFAFPCFKLAKLFRKSPPQVSAQIAAEIQTQASLPAHLSVAAVGPYVNFTVTPDQVLKSLLNDLLQGPQQGSYGSLPAKSRGTWVLEYSSPNVAKPLNIYHLRPTALGAALDRIGRFRGYHVVSINHLGDWGKQYGMLTVAFRLFGKTLKDELGMMELVDLYVKINQAAEKDPSIEEEARNAFLKLEQGDPAVTALWQKCVDISILEFNRIYARLGVNFDHIWGESFYKTQLQPLLSDLKTRGLLIESEGAQVVPVTDESGKELPPCILQKSDGATIYATRDVAAAIYRFQQFNFDRMTYIVGGEQKLHFQQVFSVLRQMGQEWVSRCEHVPTGLYRFKDAKMSTRKGNFVTLEEVLELAKQRVAQLIQERAQGNDAAASHAAQAHATAAQSATDITEAVAIGAVVFHDLSTDPARDVEFDVERVVDFEGETGPYLQYAHTRCLSILRKARETGVFPTTLFSERAVERLQKPEEIALVKILGQFPLHLERSLTLAKASQLAHYLIDVTKAFGAFYRECHVLGEELELTQARLMLVEATRRILAQGLTLMLIPLPERM